MSHWNRRMNLTILNSYIIPSSCCRKQTTKIVSLWFKDVKIFAREPQPQFTLKRPNPQASKIFHPEGDILITILLQDHTCRVTCAWPKETWLPNVHAWSVRSFCVLSYVLMFTIQRQTPKLEFCHNVEREKFPEMYMLYILIYVYNILFHFGMP